MSFAEVKIFQVLPNKIEEFEELVVGMSNFQASCTGCRSIRYLKRFYTYDDGIQYPPRPLKRVVGVVKYYSYWEFDMLEQYHAATQVYFGEFQKPLRKLLKAPFDINCGYILGEEQDN